LKPRESVFETASFLAGDVEDVCFVSEAIGEGSGESGVAEDLRPAIEVEVSGYDD
jgi:hypothetical protein